MPPTRSNQFTEGELGIGCLNTTFPTKCGALGVSFSSIKWRGSGSGEVGVVSLETPTPPGGENRGLEEQEFL